MKIKGIIWLDAIVEKINQARCFPARSSSYRTGTDGIPFCGERVSTEWKCICGIRANQGGQIPIIFFVYKSDQRILIISARDMTIAERKRYEKK